LARRSFSREFKIESVRLVSERGISVAQAARDLDIHENVLRRWVRFIKYLSVMVTCRVSVAATS
jgi:transposase-like protein